MILYDKSQGLYVAGWSEMSGGSASWSWDDWLFGSLLLLAAFFEIKARIVGERVAEPTQTVSNSKSPAMDGFIQPKQTTQHATPGKLDEVNVHTLNKSRSINELYKAKELLDAGIFTREEFNEVKRKVLDNK